ncbi:MAG: hypothetical protein HZB26_26015 [Candidatus Hydrogenedentes bacterium]|nr:hypothetical protein [Candidatus Hydrogenedentota bacterium]
MSLIVYVRKLERLNDDDGVRAKALTQAFVELACVERLGRTVVQHVHHVNDDHVVVRVVAFDECAAVLVYQSGRLMFIRHYQTPPNGQIAATLPFGKAYGNELAVQRFR